MASLKANLPTTKDKQKATGQAIVKDLAHSASHALVRPKCRKPKNPVIRKAIMQEMKT